MRVLVRVSLASVSWGPVLAPLSCAAAGLAFSSACGASDTQVAETADHSAADDSAQPDRTADAKSSNATNVAMQDAHFDPETGNNNPDEPLADEQPPRMSEPGYAWLAACPTGCVDGPCAFPGLTQLTDVDAGQVLFTAPDFEMEQAPDGSPCSVEVKLGTQVRLSATPNDGFAFAHWRGGHQMSDGLLCPCEDSTQPECEFEADEDVYCGAVFEPL